MTTTEPSARTPLIALILAYKEVCDAIEAAAAPIQRITDAAAQFETLRAGLNRADAAKAADLSRRVEYVAEAAERIAFYRNEVDQHLRVREDDDEG